MEKIIVSFTCIDDESPRLRERVIALFVNGRYAATPIIIPDSVEEFVIGHLFSEEIIRTLKDIESIRVEENRVSVLTTDPFRITGRRKTVLSGCGGSTSYIDLSKLPSIQSGLSLSLSDISSALMDCSTDTPFPAGAFLCGKDGVIIRSEDLEILHAVDRVIGSGLKADITFSETFLIISGMISSELVRRSLLAGIPILLGRSAPTDLAVRIAGEMNLTLGTFSSDGALVLYTHPERISVPG
ncbi:hypothetical protein RJ53_00080 [Methanocalculus chunghsingensis]|uniref:Sulfur carrier protein FdhD n=1 Tax=Methanocalculus chunghsingensis TaxID=156457 RepID=A0A8J7W5L2_9EURY|nr:formate dehydrogenase accessory sulfurtransferase FdhD [Methanocalculus chunghsingensis]MBR1367973.1 hypothetical protein [Methanocalculus chunghsingensis]